MAKNHITHALAQIEFHKAQAAKWEQYVTLHMELYGEEAQRGTPPVPSRPSSAPSAPPTKGAIAETRAGARLILEEAGGYVQSAELIDKLKEMGVEVGGAQPSSTLSARLSGDDEIESRRGYGYRLKKFAELDGTAGSRASEAPAVPLFPNSGDEDGREVAHDNMTT